MRRVIRLATATSIIGLATACSALDRVTGTDSNKSKTASISSDAEAQAAFAALRSIGQFVSSKVSVGFHGPVSVPGAAGVATVSGSKSAQTTSSSSSTTSTSNTDLYVDLAAFQASASAMTATGQVRWYEYSYSRTACSYTTCASASEHSQYLEGSAVEVSFEYDGKQYADMVAVDASQERGSSSWSVALTNRAGQTFRFTNR